MRLGGHERWDDAQRIEVLEMLRHGMRIDGKELLPAQAAWINADQLKVILVQGMHRQLRKMIDRVGASVKALK